MKALFGRILMIGLWAGLLAGCGAKEVILGDGDTEVRATLVASDDLNPDADGRPSPIVVRAYVLRSPIAFQDADFFAIYDNEGGTLGQDMLDRYQVTVEPGESIDETFILKKDSGGTHVGIIAAYRDIEQANWRAVIEPREGKKRRYTIRLDQAGLRVIEE